MTSSIRYAELALAEASINDDGAFSCKLKPAFDIKLLPFVQYVSQAVSESWHVPRSQFSNSAYYSKMKCQMQQFVEANPAEKSRFDRAFPKQGTTENNSRWLLEYNLLREKSDAYYLGDHTIDSAKMLSCISSDIPDWFKQEFSENLKQAASALRERDSSGEKNIQEIVKKQSIPMMFFKKFHSISRLKKSEIGTSEDRPPQEEDLLNKYKNDPDLFSAFDAVTDANTQNEAEHLNEYIKSTMKKFEQLLKTPFGNRYKKTYEALRKCESENTH